MKNKVFSQLAGRHQRVNRDLTKPRRRLQRERHKTIDLISKTTTRHLHHAFLYIYLPSLHNYDQILSLLGNRNGKALNSTISVRTWARSALSSSSQNPLLFSNRANWDNREKNENEAKSVFKRCFHRRRRCRIARYGNVKKTIGLMSKTTTLHVHHPFLYVSLQSLHNYDVKWPNFKFTWERERQGDKFYHLCLNSGAVDPSLQLQTKFSSFK